ncbi:hypothetical protein LTR91_008758 [Friedmanniomyces endolithicus]|uniref:Uncharacterized protein n=1 Tax=Friedmanniomyces endolithicus TaxID=329885 RepID=A0AAN6QUQ4_9PEZI|nr:hypothetical protein LTR94_017667 [Friedmanniomyces endolithicus]KAK0773745.1 hypothetical protein LTR59_015154 [Friedmanniomyces endolithicus]KAK0781425.1 hypothetical protein LTR38_013745 [Friedmanniomyces endolithicus]KAK0804003.1 hypothetical protein LTR75_007794 [Friedmanniomyces endolithicus]KAK0849397.1 hypothetical protein LTR03_005274 [Friedmanniomyces endolithicus]
MDELIDSSVFVKTLLEDPEPQILAGDSTVLKRAKTKKSTVETLGLKVSELRTKLASPEQDLLDAENRARDYHTERELAAATAKPSAKEAELKQQLDCALKEKLENEVVASTFAD